MTTIPVSAVLEQLPMSEVEISLAQYLQPLLERLPEERLRRVALLSVQGILGSESPVVLQMAQAIASQEGETWAVAKRLYRFLENERFSHTTLQEGLGAIAQAQLQRADPAYLVIALDPVNFEKPYTTDLEGVSLVHKSTPPALNGDARITPGYPSLTAVVVNTPVPVTTYAHWFSYTRGFVSENVEIQQALTATNDLFPTRRRRYVMDAGLDDQRWFSALAQDEFVIRASHLERIVEVYNARLDRWEREALGDLVAVVPFTHTFRVRFTHAREVWYTHLQIGWFQVRIPGKPQSLWALVAYDPAQERTLTLLTNVPLLTAQDARSVYDDWRLRSRIEHGYRFAQEQGLDVEDMRVQTLERMQRLFLLVLAAAQFVFFLIDAWPPAAVLWIRRLGGKLGLATDLNGPYLVLRGLAALFQTASTLSFLRLHPFPRPLPTYG